MTEFLGTAHRVYTPPLPRTRLAGQLCDKFADSNVQLSVCAKAENFPLRQRKACPCTKPLPRHGAGVTTKEDLGGHGIANKATSDAHLLLYELLESGVFIIVVAKLSKGVRFH
jgi:hypothetical protein